MHSNIIRHKKVIRNDIFENIVAIAKIENIKNGDTKNEEGETEDVKIGEGILLEIMYIGNANI